MCFSTGFLTTEEDFEEFTRIIKKKISIIPNEDTANFIVKAKEISPDEKDADYFALAIKLNCPLWSNDKKLKEQNQVDIYSSEELIKMFDL